ncbi:hypothetical protein SAMN05216593_1111 [Pseudomonas asturiensis]|uniref:Uncharacterized protein n=2 Tax=Pseudomonas asturiensis TaxID=1190415 RepID=A0A1M7PIG6_9PSED|nr:hypothetical protein SAMN05216593_1111 [Pseudomonas asturiensis]
MDVAHCTADGRNYSALSFEALDDSVIEAYRRQLVCPECRGPAFFRKESTSGQAACFGARPHGENCSLAAVDSSQGGMSGPDKEERINHGERIEIDFKFGASPVLHPGPDADDDGAGRGGRFRGGQRAQTSVSHRRLSTLLKNLMHSEDFCRSDQLIALPEGEYRVKDLFVKFDEINVHHLNSFRGYWGLITDAGLSKGESKSLWLNSGATDDVSIVVDASLSVPFLERFPVADTDELSGSYVLVFGELKVSNSARKKRFIATKDISRITLSLA